MKKINYYKEDLSKVVDKYKSDTTSSIIANNLVPWKLQYVITNVIQQ